MPPSKKRTLQSSDQSEHFAKGARTDGGRRGLLASTGGDGGSNGTPASPATSSTRAGSGGGDGATRGNRAVVRRSAIGERQYLHGMATLNYQAYNWAKRHIESGDIADDALYIGFVENYSLRATEFHRRFNRSYGDVVVFGSGDCGQLGCGEAITEARRPRILKTLRGMEVNMLASGGLHSLALTEGGRVFSWGCNDEGSLGWKISEEKEDGALPSEIGGFYPSQYGPNGKTDNLLDGNGRIVPFERREEAKITQIAAGDTQSLALSTDGDVYMWGTYKDNEGRKFRNMPPKDDTRLATGNKDMTKLEDDDDPEWFKPPRGNQDWPVLLHR